MTVRIPITLGGRKGEATYINDINGYWEVVPVEQATMAEVWFEDGGIEFYLIEHDAPTKPPSNITPLS